tara:strand:+ start:1446 stop:2204 length:759 start_codon:yes stop_codon:yes gene_type:complete
MNPMYAAMKGTAMKDKKKRAGGGGGSSPANYVTVATTTGSGNYDNCVKIGLWDHQTNSYAYSNGIKDGSTSVLTTGSAVNTGHPSPTARTIQTQNFAVSDYHAAFNTGHAEVPVIIGGAIRTTLAGGNSNTNKEAWTITNSAIISQSFTNSIAAMTQSVDDTLVYPAPDRTIMSTGGSLGMPNSPNGIYNISAGAGNRGTEMVYIRHGKTGVAANDCPLAGDTMTIRIVVQNAYTPGNVVIPKAHDIVMNFV